MPIQLEVKRKLCIRSDRVKCVQFHPTEPWVLSSLYNGCAQLYNYETQANIKSFEVTNLPVRCGIFVVRKNWTVFGSDDMFVRVFNFNTMEKIKEFEAHSDYLRSIVCHPTQPFLLTSSDDMTIKMWDWDQKWALKQTFEGHIHYVMQLDFNPKDFNTFASASMDRTIKIWQLGSSNPNFTLEGHQRGVNCVSYFTHGDRPYLLSGGDDNAVKVWDYQNKSCVQTLSAHYQNINFVLTHPLLPLIISGSEDGSVKCWHSTTYRLENMLNYGLERCWAGCALKGNNEVAFGYDVGTVVVKMGRERPAASMDRTSGKVIWAKHSEILQASTNNLATSLPDGGRLPLAIKTMGNCEIFPNSISHSPNGRFISVCGDGEYVIYTSVALRSKSYGSAQDFVWSYDPSYYATRNGTELTIYRNFKEVNKIRLSNGACGLHGGRLIAVQYKDCLVFYNWENGTAACKVELNPKFVDWSDSGRYLIVASEEEQCFYVLEVDLDKLELTDDDVITVQNEISETITSGLWFEDAFIYTNSMNKLNYYLGGHIMNIAHLDTISFVLGYSEDDGRVILIDRDLSITVRKLDSSVLRYQMAIIQKNYEMAQTIGQTLSTEFRTKLAQFLEKQNLFEEALEMTTDTVHRFEIAKKLNKIDLLVSLAEQLQSEYRWKQVIKVALSNKRLDVAKHCMQECNDLSSLLIVAKSQGDKELMIEVAEKAQKLKRYNIAFLAYFVMADADKCLNVLTESGRLAEATLFCYTYLPSRLEEAILNWRQSITNKTIKQRIPLPSEYPNLFSHLSFHCQQDEEQKDDSSSIDSSTLKNAFEMDADKFEDDFSELEFHSLQDGDSRDDISNI